MKDKHIKDTATFNMKVVVKETGLKPDTLRAWEKRYGLPHPERSAGGHRLYSPRDVETLKWLVTRQEEGLSISRAVELWEQLQDDGQDPILTMPLETSQTAYAVTTGATIEAIQQEWVGACRSFDEKQAKQILTRAFALYPADQVCTQVLMRGISRIGDDWYEGNTTVQQEHFTSELAIRRLEILIASNPPPTLKGRILVVCPPSEEHTFSPLLISYLIGRTGREAIFLGANVPFENLEDSISTVKPHLVILTAQQLHSAASLMLMAKILQRTDVQTAYGGRIFNLIPEIRNRIPGFFLGESLVDVPTRVNRLLNHSISPNGFEEPSETYKRTLRSYQSHRTEIESTSWSEMMESGMSETQPMAGNLNLSLHIIAALSLGEIAFLGPDIQWSKDYLKHHNLPEEHLTTYIDSYAKAVSMHLGHEGQLISDFLIASLEKDSNSPQVLK